MIEVTDFKRGLCLVFKGEPMTIVSVSFNTPTARGGNMIAKTRLKNLVTGQVLNESIRTGEKFEAVDLEQRPCSYMYNDGSNWHFMDSESFEQFELSKDDLGENVGYLTDGLEGLRALLIDGRVVNIELPNTVELKVVETEPAIKGATATAMTKPALLETGLRLQVPPYLTTGEVIKVDTRDGHFVSRA